MPRTALPRSLVVLALAASCGSERPPEDPGVPLGHAVSALTVDQEIAKGGCTSSVVQGLSDQILDELTRCVEPGFLVEVPTAGNLVNNANHPFMEKPAATSLAAALAAKPGSKLTVNSMFRTVAQQYVLFRQASCFPAVASPGKSNHETGIAFDTSDEATWRTTLEAHGFKWFGTGDPVHFDFVGAGAVDLRGKDVLAFQRLWNRNNPGDAIAEDGGWGPDTEARMKKSPAGGFAVGAKCDPPKPDAGTDSRPPFDAGDAATDASDAALADTAKVDGDVPDAADTVPAEGGCACRASAPTRAPSDALFLSLLGLLALRRRR